MANKTQSNFDDTAPQKIILKKKEKKRRKEEEEEEEEEDGRSQNKHSEIDTRTYILILKAQPNPGGREGDRKN